MAATLNKQITKNFKKEMMYEKEAKSIFVYFFFSFFVMLSPPHPTQDTSFKVRRRNQNVVELFCTIANRQYTQCRTTSVQKNEKKIKTKKKINTNAVILSNRRWDMLSNSYFSKKQKTKNKQKKTKQKKQTKSVSQLCVGQWDLGD